MRYYIETQTWRRDKVEVWTRKRVNSYAEAKAVAAETARIAFKEQVDDWSDYQLGTSPIFINDFGEFVTIRATMFGEMAQVREGCFTIGGSRV